MNIPREDVFDLQEFESRRENVTASDGSAGHRYTNFALCSEHTVSERPPYIEHLGLSVLCDSCGKPPFMVLWQFERGRFEASAVQTELELYPTHADPIEETCNALRTRGLDQGTIALEAQSRYLVPKMHDSLRDALHGARTVNGSGIVDNVRNIKSAKEIEVMRLAAGITDRAVTAGIFHHSRWNFGF